MVGARDKKGLSLNLTRQAFKSVYLFKATFYWIYSNNNSAGQARAENDFKANIFSQQAKKQALRLEL